ncbi:MAG: 1,4-alpha-glucan branching protein GlgB [Clostridium sp.]|nr:1,4-alpha-glucan branching protein GlgB [Clostridium sp.]
MNKINNSVKLHEKEGAELRGEKMKAKSKNDVVKIEENKNEKKTLNNSIEVIKKTESAKVTDKNLSSVSVKQIEKKETDNISDVKNSMEESKVIEVNTEKTPRKKTATSKSPVKKTTTRKKTIVKKDESVLTDYAMNLFHGGVNYESYKIMGAHMTSENGKEGVRFTTWAPNAKCLWVVGDFNEFNINDQYRMEKKSQYGIWSLFIEGVKEGCKYKFAVKCKNNKINYKSDPYARYSEFRPDTASIVTKDSTFRWSDGTFLSKRKRTNIYSMPLNIYEVHLGSWKTNDGKFLTYEELSQTLPKYVEEMGYTHVEMMPLVEHPLDASWGYQGTGYYSVTSRYGSIDGFKKLINEFHKRNIGVIMDWVPGHFCKDSHGLYMFDGEPAYEYQEEWRANNAGWGTYNFDLGRAEVKSFLISNAIFWIEEYHIDGIRMDAVSNILYLDYGRNHGEWRPNIYGGKENLEGIKFMQEVNTAVSERYPNFMMIAEESTAWPKVCEDPKEGGLGFNFKWNMGWMNDVLEYVQIDTMFRKQHHGKLTFPMMYNYAENYLLPISHDEVVHGKKSLINKMFGDEWNKYAGFRVFMAFMMGHPGKKLTFMGCEFAQLIEWREFEQLDWYLLEDEKHKKSQKLVKELNALYKKHKCLWELDRDIKGFEWIDADNAGQSIYSFVRKSKKGDDALIFICNFKKESYEDYRIGVPYDKNYIEVLNTDDEKFGGTGKVMDSKIIKAEEIECHGKPYSIEITVPPMGAVVLGIQNKRRRKTK